MLGRLSLSVWGCVSSGDRAKLVPRASLLKKLGGPYFQRRKALEASLETALLSVSDIALLAITAKSAWFRISKSINHGLSTILRCVRNNGGSHQLRKWAFLKVKTTNHHFLHHHHHHPFDLSLRQPSPYLVTYNAFFLKRFTQEAMLFLQAIAFAFSNNYVYASCTCRMQLSRDAVSWRRKNSPWLQAMVKLYKHFRTYLESLTFPP